MGGITDASDVGFESFFDVSEGFDLLSDYDVFPDINNDFTFMSGNEDPMSGNEDPNMMSEHDMSMLF